MTNEFSELKFEATRSSGEVSAIVIRPDSARWLLVFGHGAGAGMRHRFMQKAAEALAEVGIATFRYQFPYIEQGKKAPNPPPILIKTVRSAVMAAAAQAKDLPLLAGGKSLGGRMTSTAASQEPLPGVKGIVFFGFPLHAPGKPSNDRAAHLYEVKVPMLFLQGTRDKLADLDLLRPVCAKLGDRAELHVVDDGDHSFNVPKRAGKSPEQILQEIAETISAWSTSLTR
ncbi:dienelactone hydrolase family protein [bacterium]|nr:dienelactone hydrolase family protein [bacterium]